MAYTATTLIQRCRRFMGDWPDLDASTASIASNGTSLTVAATASDRYSVNSILQMGTEALLVTSLASSTSLTVRRGMMGTTATSYASGSSILVRPAFIDQEYLDALNGAILATFPLIYQPVTDESLTSVAGTYEFTIPNMPSTYDGTSIPIPRLTKVSVKETADLAFRKKEDWQIKRGTTPKLQFRRDEPAGTIRVEGYGPIPPLTDFTSSLSTMFPVQAVDALTEYAAGRLLASGESRRVRVDAGVADSREQANRVGSSTAAGRDLFGRFYKRLADAAMQPMAPHKVATF